MGSYFRILVLKLVDILADYTLRVMQIYLNNVWKISITNAAAIVNVFNGVSTTLPILLTFLADKIFGHYGMLLLSSLSHCAGWVLLTLSTPPLLADATGTCNRYEPECIGHVQIILFYTSLALIAFGVSGHVSSVGRFITYQTTRQAVSTDEAVVKEIGKITRAFIATALVSLIGLLLVIFIKPWSIRFGIPAICSLVATLLFLSGSCSYVYAETFGSPLTRIFRVEERKITIGMVLMWLTFIVCGIVLAVGNTYFLQQANHMNHHIGRLKVPIPILLLLYDSSKSLATKLYHKISGNGGDPKSTAPIGIIVCGMILSILCCITAAKVENRRIHVIIKHGLLDKPDDRIPMSILWLVPQFLLLGAFEGLLENGVECFLRDRTYLKIFTKAVFGAGTMASVLSVYLSNEVSKRGGRQGWFQYTLNRSRLDNYYWTLAVLSTINLVFFAIVACCYSD